MGCLCSVFGLNLALQATHQSPKKCRWSAAVHLFMWWAHARCCLWKDGTAGELAAQTPSSETWCQLWCRVWDWKLSKAMGYPWFPGSQRSRWRDTQTAQTEPAASALQQLMQLPMCMEGHSMGIFVKNLRASTHKIPFSCWCIFIQWWINSLCKHNV